MSVTRMARSLLMVAICLSQPAAMAQPSTPSFPPVMVVSSAAIYKAGGKTIPDAAGIEKSRDLLKPIDDFLTYLGHCLDDKPGTVDLGVPYEQLQQWASSGALLEPPDTPGRVARVWISTGFAFVVLKFKYRGVRISQDVSRWLRKLAAEVRNDYKEPLKGGSYTGQYSNVYPWAAATNALCALVNNDQECLRFQDEAWNNMIAEIRHDGVLPGELGRRGRAREYHMKAAAGLLVLLDARRALGIADDPGQIAKLKRLLDMIGDSLRNPEPLAAAAGAPQEETGVYDFRIPYAFNCGILPETWTTYGPKEMNWFYPEYGGGDTRVSAQSVEAAARLH
jgi:hypothetical protein